MRIDWWTLALQTVNVLVLVWILARFFFRPVADIVTKRQEEANKLLSDAAAARQSAADARADVDRVCAGIAAERDRMIVDAQEAARIEKENLLAQASKEVAKLHGEAEAAIARDRVAAEQMIVERAGELAVEIAQRLLGRLPSETVLGIFLDGLCRKLHALSTDERSSFTSATADHPVEVLTTTPSSRADMEQIRTALIEAFGSELPLDFHSDPALIAGVELHSRSMIVRNSWRADLDQIREELGHVKQLGRS